MIGQVEPFNEQFQPVAADAETLRHTHVERAKEIEVQECVVDRLQMEIDERRPQGVDRGMSRGRSPRGIVSPSRSTPACTFIGGPLAILTMPPICTSQGNRNVPAIAPGYAAGRTGCSRARAASAVCLSLTEKSRRRPDSCPRARRQRSRSDGGRVGGMAM
jgi:hypothetical protein